MYHRFPLAALAAVATLAAPAAVQAQEAAGAWHGVLVAGSNILRIVVHVKAGADGKLEGELVSPDQSPRGFPLSDVKLAGDTLTFGVPEIYGAYQGKWDAARKAWVGAWKQGPASLPLTLEQGEAAAPAPPPAAKPPPGSVAEVTVQGQAAGTRVDVDRRSYDISKDLQTTTGSVADALRNVPSVQVDVQGNVALRGDPNVTIMVDGKPSSLFKGPNRGQILQNLPANAFERVEVMTNPSAAFRPDGSAGIINLIPKKARQMGRAGSLRVTAAPGDKGQLNLNLSQVGKKLTLTGDAAWAHEPQDVTLKDRRSSLDPVSGTFLDSAQDTAVTQTVDVLTARAAFDYDPDSKTRISGELRDTNIRADASSLTTFSGEAPGGSAIAFDRTGDVQLKRNNLAANGSWRRKFGSDPDHELVVDLTQEHNTDRTRRNQVQIAASPTPPSRTEDIRNDVDADQTHVKVDYTRPFEDNRKLKTGYELEYDASDFDNFGLTGPLGGPATPNPGLIDQFNFRQAINGVYATWQQPVGDKLTVLAGLRAEDTQIDLKDPVTGFRGSNDFTRFYPSLHLSWKVDDTRQLTASYSERIVRPAPSDYNPFPVYQDPFNFRAGNPNLQPSQTHSFEAAGQYRKGFSYYLATLYYRQNEKGVTDVVTDLGGGVLLTTKQNLSSSRNGGLELVASGRRGKVTYGVSTDAFWQEIDATGLGFADKRSGWTISGRGQITWQATPKDQFQLVGQLTGKRLTPQGYREPMGLMFAGYRHQFNKDWALSVSARDLLDSFHDTLVIDTPTLHDRVETKVKLRAVFVSLTYSFGQGPRKDTGIDYGTTGAGAGGAAPR